MQQKQMMQVIGLVVFIKKIRFKKAIKKYDDETLELLDEEMSSEEAFYYAKLKLYLTKDYIINYFFFGIKKIFMGMLYKFGIATFINIFVMEKLPPHATSLGTIRYFVSARSVPASPVSPSFSRINRICRA